ncbi:hypothetical protein ONS95_007084 [Cadophora gregata]|uniref:uncharacterized protein n=1 Tax=Cadophora gregata TaxID=51156 RepID=UPI0026DA768F|nr:uncharacterized protein ONS95_007084 [Cadophora gregata]KAK0100629.1 hypothetical protein ONS95_007084 [Cadophora gregata]KAK0117371.1 hypothetical protein ONS96_013201 [Cadophora gregata f. sp. sojae]
MQLSALVVLPFLGFTLAAAVPAPLEAEEFNSTESALDKRIANTFCERFRSPSGIFQYTIWTAGWGNSDDTSPKGCGSGVLDNLRGQCGGGTAINSWKCYHVYENPHDTRMTFQFNTWTVPSGGSKCVQDAIRLASPSWKKESVTCRHLN